MASNQVELLALVHSLRQEFRDAHKEKENKRKTKTNADAADATAGGAAKDEPPAKTAAAFFKKCFVTDAEIRTKYGDAEIDANERKQGKNRKEEKILEAIASSCFNKMKRDNNALYAEFVAYHKKALEDFKNQAPTTSQLTADTE